MTSIEQLKIIKKEKKLTLQQIADLSGIPKRTVDDIFSGHTLNPRLDTIQAIERALGLAPEWTEEEIAQGVGNHAIVLTDKEKDRLRILADGDNILGEEYVDMYMRALELLILQKDTK